MLFQILLAILLGILAGTFTGLAPGIHINLVALLLFISSSLLLQFFSPISLAVFIIAMATVHCFLDFVPSIFLGAPEEATALSVLPGHRLLLQGRGYEAVKLTVLGSYIGLILIIILAPIFVLFLPSLYSKIEIAIPYLLIAASLFLIAKEKKKFWALLLFVMSGVLGMLSLNFFVINQPLFPLLTGLFGASTLIISISQKTKIPRQKIICRKIEKKEAKNAVISGTIAGPLCSFLPGLGASQAAVLGSSFTKLSEKGFLILLGIIGTLVAGLNFIALYAIDKPRSGAAVIVGKLVSDLSLNSLLVFLASMLVAGSIAVLLAIFFAKLFARNIEKINYSKICMIVLAFLIFLSFLISGWLSLIILAIATCLGLLANLLGIKRIHLMGCLILPVVLYFLL